jgi:hypothetical protein
MFLFQVGFALEEENQRLSAYGIGGNLREIKKWAKRNNSLAH